MATAAPFTLATGVRRVHGHEGTRLQPEPIGTFFGDLRRDFVPQDEGLRMGFAARGPLPVVMQVAAAETDASHSDQHLLVCGRGEWNRFDPHVSRPV